MIIFLVVPFNKISVFSKDLITFIIFFVSLLVRVIPEPVIYEVPFLIFLRIKISLASARMSLFLCF